MMMAAWNVFLLPQWPIGANMITPAEAAAVVAATKDAVDLFDRFGGQVKSFLLKGPKEAEGADDRWKMKIGAEEGNLVVKQDSRTLQIISHEKLSEILHPNDLALVKTYEQKMNEYFNLWRSVYSEKDSSQYPLINAKVDNQLEKLIRKMRGQLLGILGFLERIGIQLDDHYHCIRQLVTDVQPA